MAPKNGSAAENELKSLINEGALRKEKRVVRMTSWNDLNAELPRKHGDVHELDTFGR